jgi:hypothetical protein
MGLQFFNLFNSLRVLRLKMTPDPGKIKFLVGILISRDGVPVSTPATG